jgi:hypothetical protein
MKSFRHSGAGRDFKGESNFTIMSQITDFPYGNNLSFRKLILQFVKLNMAGIEGGSLGHASSHFSDHPHFGWKI